MVTDVDDGNGQAWYIRGLTSVGGSEQRFCRECYARVAGDEVYPGIKSTPELVRYHRKFKIGRPAKVGIICDMTPVPEGFKRYDLRFDNGEVQTLRPGDSMVLNVIGGMHSVSVTMVERTSSGDSVDGRTGVFDGSLELCDGDEVHISVRLGILVVTRRKAPLE